MKLSTLEKLALRQEITDFAKEIGFDLVGFSPAKIEEKYLKSFDEWLSKNHEADMSYMRKIDQRRDMEKILPGAKSVIVLLTNYYRQQAGSQSDEGKVARYAYGRDYHKVIGKKLKQLEKFIAELVSASSPTSTPPSKLDQSIRKSARASRSIPCGDFLPQKMPQESHFAAE